MNGPTFEQRMAGLRYPDFDEIDPADGEDGDAAGEHLRAAMAGGK